MKAFFLVLWFYLVFLWTLPRYAEYSLQVLGGRSGGEFVFETGNRFPNLSGITGGSRISFERDFHFGGIGGKYFRNNWELQGKFTTTGWYVRSGRARDEDFFLFSVSQERAHHIAFREFAYYDSVNVYSGKRNFADGVGKSSLSEYNLETLVRYYSKNANSDTYNSGFFWSGGFIYTYNKYIFYDVVQWIATNPIFYQPIGYGLNFSNSILQFPIGFGYRWNWEDYYIDTSFHYLHAILRTRDFHKQRNINFNSSTIGPGILASLELGYRIHSENFIFTRLNQHRFFTKGNFVAVGGFTESDILANYLGKFKAHINTKDWSLEIGWEYRSEKAHDK